MKNTRKISLLIGSIITLLIISTPYLLYLHQSIPIDKQEINTIFGILQAAQYADVQIYVYFLLEKFTPFLLLIIWFLTNKNWWAHALIIPISVYLFQLISVINDSQEFIAEVEFIYTVPIAIIVMVILYFIRSKMAIYIQAIDLKKEMDENMNIQKNIE